MKIVRRLTLFSVLVVLMAIGSGCATSGRYIAFREFQPSTEQAAASPLQGKSVYVEKFAYEPYAGRKRPPTITEEPPGFTYHKMSKEDKALWNQEVKTLRPAFHKSDANRVGFVRNGFGAAMSGVFTLNDPGDWLKQCIELELKQQGATVAAAPENADLAVGGKIIWLEVDMYMQYWADLITDFAITPRGGPPVERTIHTHGSQGAWSSSSFEYYQPVRMCLQKTYLLLQPEIDKALKR